MDTRRSPVFIMMSLFYLINVIYGASLGNSELFNEIFDPEEQGTVFKNIKKSFYADELKGNDMKNMENLFTGFLTNAKNKKTIYTSKTFFGSDQFSDPHGRPRDDSQHQASNSLGDNYAGGLQPLHGDLQDDLLQQHIYKRKNHAISYSNSGNENSDLPREVADISEDKKISDIYSRKHANSLLEPKSSDDTIKDSIHKFSKPKVVDTTAQINFYDLPESTRDNDTSKDNMNEVSEMKNVDNISEVPDLLKFDIDEFQGSGDMAENFGESLRDSGFDSKSGRIVDFFPTGNGTSECTTPKGEPGHCRSVSQCPLSDPMNNFNLFLQYVCLSRGVLVGICCPDNPVIEISDDKENSTETSLAEFKQPVEGCGANTNTRIVGGKISLPHEWKWMVALLRRNRFFCGGVIINDWYILTAAHCLMGVKLKDLKVRLGEHNFSEKNEKQDDISVAEIKRHALFVTLTFQHDIALLKLKRRIKYTKFIGSICLPHAESGNFSNVNATVVGWGTVAFGGSASPVLRQVTIPVWDNDECDKTYRLERITNAFMCAGSPENGEDACQGDSGGPLMTLNDEGRWEVIGIVSWGRRCGDPTFPGVYTRVTTYLDWISANTN